QGCIVGNRGQKIEPGRIRALVGRQREPLGMWQLPDLDLDHGAHEAFSTALAMCAISLAATCSLVIAAHESTAISAPLRVKRCTVLRSPPITPSAGETSLARIQSQPLRASLALAFSIRFSVSAANPITRPGRLSRNFEMVARISGFSTSSSRGVPAAA